MQTIDFKNINLPFQPHILAELLKLNDDTNMNFHDLDRLIRSDQNLAALILKVANSSFYSRGNEIRSLQQAVGMIGFKTVISFSMAASAKNAFEGCNYPKFREFIWKHSVITALIARHIATEKKIHDAPEECFTGGLLHDIGKVILNISDRKKFSEVIEKVVKEHIIFTAAEEQVFGITHSEAGRQGIIHWKLPKIFESVTGSHHQAEEFLQSAESDHVKMVVSLVQIANMLANAHGFGNKAVKFSDIPQSLIEFTGITPEELQYFTTDYKDHIKEDPFYRFFVTIS